jgi:biotin operon repressor
MSIKLMSQVWSINADNITQKLILLKLADNASDEGYCYPSMSTIAKHCQCSRSTVNKHISLLKDKGILNTKRRYKDDGSFNSNGYTLLLEGYTENRTGVVRNTDRGSADTGQGLCNPRTGVVRMPDTNHHITINEPSVNRKDLCQNKDVTMLFDYWIDVMGKPKLKTKLTDKRKRVINAIVKQYSLDDIKLAIDNCARSSWHNGKNERGQVFNDIELICRSGDKLERFRDMPVDDGLDNLTRSNLQHMNDFLNEG